jgi:hypothetical protein
VWNDQSKEKFQSRAISQQGSGLANDQPKLSEILGDGSNILAEDTEVSPSAGVNPRIIFAYGNQAIGLILHFFLSSMLHAVGIIQAFHPSYWAP